LDQFLSLQSKRQKKNISISCTPCISKSAKPFQFLIYMKMRHVQEKFHFSKMNSFTRIITCWSVYTKPLLFFMRAVKGFDQATLISIIVSCHYMKKISSKNSEFYTQNVSFISRSLSNDLC